MNQTNFDDLARKHGFSSDAVKSMAQSLVEGNLSMAQFQHPEFGGSGQWMRGGMLMLSDMFNNGLKARVDALCNDLSEVVSQTPELAPASPARNWWGEGLGAPASSGGQNSDRYAYFPQTRRLAVEKEGRVTVYDTLDHQIGGFSQQQSGGRSLTFQSQHGSVDLSSLPVISGEAPASVRPVSAPASSSPPPPASAGEPDIFATLEKLAALHSKGILTDEEFASKKAELLSRL